MAFTATDSAIEGFRIAREKPLAIVGWAAVCFLSSALSWYFIVTLGGAALQTYSTMTLTDTAAMFRSMPVMMRLYAVLVPLRIAELSILGASINRIVLRPQERGFFWLKLGGDEARQCAVLVVMAVLLFTAFMVSAFIAAIVVNTALGTAASGMPSSQAVIAATGIAFAAAAFAFFALLAKFSLASPMTYDLKRIEIFAAARLTAGRFGPMIAAYLLAFCMALLVGVLLGVIYFAIASLIVGGVNSVGEVLNPKFITLGTYFSPLRLLYLLFASVTDALGFAIWFGVAPRAYQQLRGAGASVF